VKAQQLITLAAAAITLGAVLARFLADRRRHKLYMQIFRKQDSRLSDLEGREDQQPPERYQR
jgi:hypothetical protein